MNTASCVNRTQAPAEGLRAPFPWFGGKRLAADLVWDRFGNVGIYVEPFAGSLAVLFKRPHAPRVETVNDRDTYIANFWRALRADPEQVAYWADWPVNEADLQARHLWLVNQPEFRDKMLADPDHCDAKIAGWWVWGISQWIGGGWCSRPEWTGRGQGGRAPRGITSSVFAGPPPHKKRPANRPYGTGVNQKSPTAKRPQLSGNGPTGVHRKLPVMDRSTQRGSQSPAIVEWMYALADRLRRVRVCCGDWARVVTPSCTSKLGGGQLTGVFLDPPYSHEVRDARLYAIEQADLSGEVRAWALQNGSNPLLRIALCGLEGEHDMPSGWEPVGWRAPRGYSNAEEPRREIIWFSPACLRQPSLFEQEVSGGILA